MHFDNILFEIKDQTARIVINRPDVLNILNSKTMDDLDAAVSEIENNSDIRVVIVTGAGDKAFAAGADIAELEVLDGATGKAFAQRGQTIFNHLEGLDRPVIAAVNGFALGGGCELALACHFRIASENAKFGHPEVKLGMIPGYGGTQRLPRVVGMGIAMELILTGNIIDATEALRIGLVNRVVPAPELTTTIDNLVQTLLSRGPVAVRRALYAMTYGMQVDLTQGLDIEANLFGDVCGSKDKNEGARAFLAKRQPKFKNE